MRDQVPDGSPTRRGTQPRRPVGEAVQDLDGGELGHVRVDRGVEVEVAAVALLQSGHGAHRLRHGRDPERAVGVHRLILTDRSGSGRALVDEAVVVGGHGDDVRNRAAVDRRPQHGIDG
jgi:hypothetical protein